MGSSKVYEKQLTVANGEALVVGADEHPKLFAVQVPHEGTIHKLIAVQNGGTAKAFTVKAYNRPVEDAIDPLNSDSIGSDGSNEVLSRIIPEQSGLSGAAMELYSTEGYPYRNMEGTHTVPIKRIFIMIDATAPVDETTWEVSITLVPSHP